MAIDMSQFYQVFFDESAEHLAAMESLLLDLDVQNPDPEQLNAIFRAAHSIKGSAGTFGFSDLADTTHILENLLDRIRKSELKLRPEMVDAFLEAGDQLKIMLEAHQGRGEANGSATEDICSRLRELSREPQAQMPSTELEARSQMNMAGGHVFDIQFVPTEVSAADHGVAGLLEELRALGAVEVLAQPEMNESQVGYWRIRLTTNSSQEAFAEQVDFIAENGAWRIVEEKPANTDSEAGFGFFESSPGVPEEVLGYGFFEPEPEALANSVSPQVEEGYGFFEPITLPAGPEQSSVADGDHKDDGFGFFQPLPTSIPTAIHQDEGTSGLFESKHTGLTEQIPSLVREASAVEGVRTVQKQPTDDAVIAKAVKAMTSASAGVDSSIRVSVEKVDQLINLVGELVITQAMLLQTVVQMQDEAPERLVGGLAQLERNTRDLQESVMSIRMMPISFVFSRFPRVVRDLSGKLGKQVELRTAGETTELDKSLIERIADPLTHLIRNSLDHGIETPEMRIAAGKRPMGTITLKACHQGGNIVIEVGDDGAGLNRQKILAKARERGLQVSDQMTDQEVFNLIFEAGFSTADQVTDVSGRGVGMDVVRRNIQSMGGRVEIESMIGIGTRMTVRLPLTLAILDGMSIAVGDQTYIVPLSYVIESFQPGNGDVKTLSNRGRVIQVRGEYLPVVILHELFNLPSRSSEFSHGIMVVIDADGIQAALFVDALVGQHQVVIKSLEANYRRVTGISGATIMGDGHVALILDVSAIAGMARNNLNAQMANEYQAG